MDTPMNFVVTFNNIAQGFALAIHMPVTIPVSHGEKPKKFNGLNFKRWQQKMMFYLTILNLTRFMIEEAPKLKEDETDVQVINAVLKLGTTLISYVETIF